MAVETRSFLLALLLVPGVAAQEDRAPTRTLVAAPLGPNETIDLDGRLDEAAWARAIPAEGFRQVDPDNRAPVTERTEVRILIDADRLILGIMAYDSDPDAVRGNVMQRDAPFLGDDRFAWTLDTYQDGRTGYYFEINPAGGMADGLGGGGGGAGGEVEGAEVAGAAAGALLAPEAAAPTRPGMAFGTPAWPWTRAAVARRSSCLSGRSTSTPSSPRRASTSSGRSAVRTRKSAGTATRAIRPSRR